MHWRLILEEFGHELKYIKVENNVVADALSRLEKSNCGIPGSFYTARVAP